jgi:hypothetical protein
LAELSYSKARLAAGLRASWTYDAPVVALAFVLTLGVPFAVGCAAMAPPVSRVTNVVIAVAPVVLLAVATTGGVFWIGDVGGLVIAVITTWAWLLGVGSSGNLRSLARVIVRVVRV